MSDETRKLSSSGRWMHLTNGLRFERKSEPDDLRFSPEKQGTRLVLQQRWETDSYLAPTTLGDTTKDVPTTDFEWLDVPVAHE